MKRLLLILLFTSPLFLWGRSIAIISKIRINKKSTYFESVYTTKRVWNTQETTFLDTLFKFGKIPTSGTSRGLTVFLQPNGAWGVNIGDGKNRIDYLPTEFQKLQQDKEYSIKLILDFTQKDLWIYFDGKQKAVYNLEKLNLSMKDFGLMLQTLTIPKKQGIEVTQLHIKPTTKLLERTPKAIPADEIKVISLNTRQGGKHHGVPEGIKTLILQFQSENPDIICLQQMAEVGAAIADFGDYYYYHISEQKAILSKFPITKTYKRLNIDIAGGCQTGAKGKLFNVYNVMLAEQPIEDSVPAFKKKYVAPLKPVVAKVEKKDDKKNKKQKNSKSGKKKKDKTVWISDTARVQAAVYPYDTLVWKTRVPQIKKVMDKIKSFSLVAPTIIGGTFNEPSYLDWTKKQIESSGVKMVYDRPVSRLIDKLGYTDSFYKGAAGKNAGITYKGTHFVRIDYIYSKRLKVINSYTSGFENKQWSSNHAMVISTFKLP